MIIEESLNEILPCLVSMRGVGGGGGGVGGWKDFCPCSVEPRYVMVENIVDPDQITSDKAICSGSTMFLILIHCY